MHQGVSSYMMEREEETKTPAASGLPKNRFAPRVVIEEPRRRRRAWSFILRTTIDYMKYALEIDAADILGISSDAKLQEIHDAYRVRVKKHHPDVGGDEWAFRAVARAYELLTNARIHARVGDDGSWIDLFAESARAATPTARATPPPPSSTPPPPDHEMSWVSAGVADRIDDPAKIVDVELFTIRFEIAGPLNLLQAPKDRNLSSCLNVAWPSPPLHAGEAELTADPKVLALVTKSFDAIPKRTKAVAHWSTTKDGRFVGWLSYPTANQAFEAFGVFHQGLREKGLGARQTTRELFIAREPR